MSNIEDFVLGLITNLLSSIIEEEINYHGLNFFEKRRIKRRVEDATAEVVEPLIPFIRHEGISEEKQRRLIETCIEELRPLANEPARLFEGSLDGQKIYVQLYASRSLPDVILEDGLKGIYSLIFPSIATLICKIPAAVKDWENQAWSENYRRLDLVVEELRSIFLRVEALVTAPERGSDDALELVRKTMSLKIGLEIDLTGLGAPTPVSGKFDNFYVHSELEVIKRILPSFHNQKPEPEKILLSNPQECLNYITKENQYSLVIGPPGAGKSTWTQWLQREFLAKNTDGFAVRVELRNYANKSLLPLYELVRNSVNKHIAEELTTEKISRWLQEDRIVFILDGFDEISPAQRDVVFEWIIDLVPVIRGCTFVITSRPLTTNHLEKLGEIFQHIGIQTFDEARITDYITRWYLYTPLLDNINVEVDSKKLSNSWINDPVIGPLTGNPLLLSTLLMVHHLDGELPQGRSQLYVRYIEGMLGLWDDRRKVIGVDFQMSREEKRTILRRIALFMFLENKDVVDEDVLLDWLNSNIPKKPDVNNKDILTVLRERTGLLIGPGVYSFSHKSISEFFVADVVLQGDQRINNGQRIDRLYLLERCEDDKWNTVIFLWAGLSPVGDLESFIIQCIEGNSVSLAAGLIYDQYLRIPQLIKRELLLKIMRSEYDLSVDLIETIGPNGLIRLPISNTGYLAYGPENSFPNHNLPYEEIGHLWLSKSKLRSLNNMISHTFPDVDITNLLQKSIKDGTINIQDCEDLSNKNLYLHLIVLFTVNLEDLESLLILFNARPPANIKPLLWFLFLLTQLVVRKNSNIDYIIQLTNNLSPEYKEYLPLILISHYIRINTHMNRRKAQGLIIYSDSIDTINKLLKYILITSNIKMSSIVLKSTTNWAHPSFGYMGVCDLLEEFGIALQHSNAEGFIEDEALSKRAERIAQKLITQRNE